MKISRPDHSESVAYYYTYIDHVGDGDIREILRDQLAQTLSFYEEIGDDQSLSRYAPDKWSIRELVSHVNDTERVFVARAFWFARGFDTPMPSFDQHIGVANANADKRSWKSHVDEFRVIRESTLAFFDSVPDEAWSRHGIASGNPFTVKALAYITAGHVTHHNKVLRERYLNR
jgi:hypothetical protein